METYNVIVRFFQTGGTFMYPIAVVLVLGVVIAIERWLVLTAAKMVNQRAFDDVLPLLRKGDYAALIKKANASKAAVYRIVGAGVARVAQGARREDVEYAMEEGVMEALPRLEKRTPYLATLANIATLLGLLGTIIGLIAAFTAVANASPAEKASMLSSSISVAMNTTAFGLISAIPLLVMHALLQTKTTEIVDSFEMVGVKVLNALSSHNAKLSKTRAEDSSK